MLTLVKLDKPVPHKAEKLGVGDVIATHNETQHLRRVDVIDIVGDVVQVFVSKPRNGGGEAIHTFPKGTLVNVMGRVEEPAAPKAPKKAAPKARAATAKNPAPVKVTKVDAVAQTTPAEAKPAARKPQTRTAASPTFSSIRVEVREAIRGAISELIVTEVKALLAEALA